MGAFGSAAASTNLRGVEHLHRQPPADLHLIRIEGGIGAWPAARRPVTNAVRAVLVEQPHRRDDVAFGFRHLLAVGIEHPAGERRVLPWQRVVLEMRPQDGVEQPRADDVVRLRTQIHRKRLARTDPDRRSHPHDDLRRQRRRRPRVHDVGIADKPARLAALVRPIAGRHVGRRIDRQRSLRRPQSGARGRCVPSASIGTTRGTARRRSAAGSRTSRRSGRWPSSRTAPACTPDATSARGRARAAPRGTRSS